MRRVWSKEMEDKLTELYPKIDNRELCKIFGFTISSIRSKASELGLKKIIRTRNWTISEVEELKKMYSDTDNDILVTYFGRTKESIYNKAHVLGIKKSDEFIAKAKLIWSEHVREVGKEYRFKKGMKTWNKGIKGYMGANVTSFKKGHQPKCYLPVGTESEDRDGYVKIKIADPNIWELKHRVIWEERFGSIPDKHAVIFIDGNKRNFDLTNLVLVHRRDLLYFNRWGKYPPEILEAQKLIYQLKNLIKDNAKEQN
jgi:hypothetical protein